MNDKNLKPPVRTSINLVLGAGGVEGPAHIGVLRYLEDRNISSDRLKITGASVGALIGAFIANGYDSKQLSEIFLSESFRYPNWEIWSKCLHFADPRRMAMPASTDPRVWATFWTNFWIDTAWPWAVDLRPWLQFIIKEYKLTARANLRMVAADAITREGIIFEGSDYELIDGLAASTAAITGLGIRPVWYPPGLPHRDTSKCESPLGHLLVDGFYYHPIPADLCDSKPAIVSKIGFASQLPRERLSPWDLLMHLREMSLAPQFNLIYPDPVGHIIIESGMPEVATTNVGVSSRTLEALIEHGYEAASRRLKDVDLDKLEEKHS